MPPDQRSSEPTPSPIPPPPRSPTGSHAAAETIEERALRVALEARQIAREARAELSAAVGVDPDPENPEDAGRGVLGRVGVLERTIGREPSSVHGTAATGMLAIVLSIRDAVQRLEAVIEADKAAQIEAAARRARLAWAIGIPLVVAALLGAGALAWRWLATLHH